MKFKKRLIIVIFLVFCVLFIYRVQNNHKSQSRALTPVSTPTQASVTPSQASPTESTTIPTKSSPSIKANSYQLSAHILIEMPFTSQAPLTNWDALHEDACEEASLIMVMHYIDNTKIASKEGTDAEIKDMVQWETDNKYDKSVTLLQLTQIAKHYGKSKYRIESAIKNNIEKELANAKPVIVPAAGRELNNPNFKQPGPIYHMLVIKGYDKDGFIANDPGTRKGEGYRYSFDTLLGAIHDYDADNIDNGAKKYLVFD